MDEIETLASRLQDLGGQAVLPPTDVAFDVARGRTALRRRNARRGAGVAVLTLGAAAVAVPALVDARVVSGPHLVPSGAMSAHPYNLCKVDASDFRSGTTVVQGEGVFMSTTPGASIVIFGPDSSAARHSYQRTAAAILDPTGTHTNLKRDADSNQSGWGCDPATGDYLTSVGTTIGWTTNGALGDIRLSVDSPRSDQPSQVEMFHDNWSVYRGPLPAGLTSTRVAYFANGHAVVAQRRDGLKVSVEADGVWGNNAAPGSRAATDLPGIEKLLELAASPRLTFPAP